MKLIRTIAADIFRRKSHKATSLGTNNILSQSSYFARLSSGCILLCVLLSFLSCRPPVEDTTSLGGSVGGVLLDESERKSRLSINDVDIFNKMAVFVFHGGREKRKVRLICRGIEGCLKVCQHLDEKNCRKSTVNEVVDLWLKVISDYTEWEQALVDLNLIATEPAVSAFLKNADKQNQVLQKLFNFSALADCPRAEDPDKELRTSASGTPPTVSLFLADVREPASLSDEQCPPEENGASGDATDAVGTVTASVGGGASADGDGGTVTASVGASDAVGTVTASVGASADGDGGTVTASVGGGASADGDGGTVTASVAGDNDDAGGALSGAGSADANAGAGADGKIAVETEQDQWQCQTLPLNDEQAVETVIKKIVDGSQAPFNYLAFHGFIKQCFGHKTRTFSEMSAQIENKDAFDLADQFISNTCGDNAECVRLAYCSISSDLIWKYLPEELKDKGCEYASFSGML